MSQSIIAAFMSIDPASPHHLFSAQGNYLAPSSTDVPTYFETEDLRTTRTLITRLVTASQDVAAKKSVPGSDTNTSGTIRRKTLVVTLDFHAPEEPFLNYSRESLYSYEQSPPSSLSDYGVTYEKLVGAKGFEIMKKQFGLLLRMFEHRPVPSSAGAQNALGFLNKGTSQDKYPLVKRTNATWLRVREPLSTYKERCASIA